MAARFDSAGWLELQPDDDHRVAWRFLASQVQPYPPEVFVPPMRQRATDYTERRFVSAELVCDPDSPTFRPRPVALVCSDGTDETVVELGAGLDGVVALERSALARAHRGRFLIFWGGGRFAFHVLLREYGHLLASRGWSLRPIGTGTEIKAVLLRRGKAAFYWTDAQAMTGCYELAERDFVLGMVGQDAGWLRGTRALWQAMFEYQRLLLREFGTGLTLTAGMAAVRAASRFLPESAWLWRPPPGLVALCRAGGGYRGGYVYARPYRGPGIKLDINRLYTWAISQALPLRTALGPCVADGVERAGVYLCTVRGPGSLPAYLGVWRGWGAGFKRALWSGDACLAVLPEAEFAGLRALGYGVQPGWGYVFTATFSLADFAGKCARLAAEYGRESPVGQVAKKLPNALYGKLGEGPDRAEVIYQTEPPGDDYWPFITDEGEEVAGLWVRTRRAFRGHQHVDVAATITAEGRSTLYRGLAEIIRTGGHVLAVDTDGALVRHPNPEALDLSASEIGKWRLVSSDPDMVVAGPKLYAVGSTSKAVGVRGISREQVEIAHQHGSVYVAGKRMAAPWSGRPMASEGQRRVNRAR